MALKGSKPSKADKDRFARLQCMGCVVCAIHHETFSPAEVHHIDGKTKPGAHKQTIPLCFRHHREGVDCELYTSRHPHLTRFEERYGTEQYLLERTNHALGGTEAVHDLPF